MEDQIDLIYQGKSYKFPLVKGAEDEAAIDIKTLRAQTGLITLDPGFKNTGSCESEITFLDGEEGILRYRGYSIEDLANNSSFIEVAYLLEVEEEVTEVEKEEEETPFVELVANADLSKGKKVFGKYNPSTDTPTHQILYKSFNHLKSISHITINCLQELQVLKLINMKARFMIYK